MATRYVTLPANQSWVLLSDQADWIAQALIGNAELHIGASAPGAGAAGHVLSPGQGLYSVVSGSVYGRSYSSAAAAKVAVSD